jgi:dienelactone hydrolase
VPSQIYRRLIVVIVAAAALAGCKGGDSDQAEQTSLGAPFAYDASKPLDLQARDLSHDSRVQLRDISFRGARDERVPAYLVVPSGQERHPAVIYAHGATGGRGDLLLQAVGFAQQGAVALVLEMNYSAIRGSTALPAGIQGVQTKTDTEVEAVVEVRRAVDLLRSLPYVKKDRIGYLGWSAGARIGAVVAGVDHRIRAFDLLAGGATPVSKYLDLAPVYLRSELRRQLGKTDPLHYVGHAAPSVLLFQDGRHDEIVPREALTTLARKGSDPKELRWYDSGHVPTEKAWADSRRWLADRLGLS